jgi:hypothetical protein
MNGVCSVPPGEHDGCRVVKPLVVRQRPTATPTSCPPIGLMLPAAITSKGLSESDAW